MTEKNRDKKPERSEDGGFSQQASSTEGSNYLAGRDMHFHQSSTKPSEKRKWLGTTQSVVTIIFLLISIGIALYITIPQNLHKPAGKILVTGVIKANDSETGISDAYITSDLDFRDTVRTATDGTFQLQVSGTAGQSIHIYVGADHYKPRNEIRELGPPLDIRLDRQ